MPEYWNAAGQHFPLPELPLEPPDCWGPDKAETGDEEHEHREITL